MVFRIQYQSNSFSPNKMEEPKTFTELTPVTQSCQSMPDYDNYDQMIDTMSFVLTPPDSVGQSEAMIITPEGVDNEFYEFSDEVEEEETEMRDSEEMSERRIVPTWPEGSCRRTKNQWVFTKKQLKNNCARSLPFPTLFGCEQCPFVTKFRWNMHAHKVKHEQQKPLSCARCPFSTTTAAQLRVHMHTHTRPHACPQCSRRFTRASNRDRHVKVVHESTRFRCPLCPATKKILLSDEGDLERHKSIFHVPCSNCSYTGQMQFLFRHNCEKQRAKDRKRWPKRHRAKCVSEDTSADKV